MSSKIAASDALICFKCQKNQPKMFKCTKCQTIHYCSTNCQKNDWNIHKQICEEYARKRNHKEGTGNINTNTNTNTSTTGTTTTSTNTNTNNNNNNDDDNDNNNNNNDDDNDNNDDDNDDNNNNDDDDDDVDDKAPKKPKIDTDSKKPQKDLDIPFITQTEGRVQDIGDPTKEAFFQLFHPQFPNVKFFNNSDARNQGFNSKFNLNITNVDVIGETVDLSERLIPIFDVFGKCFA
jgi:hypothetical protein